MSEIRYNIHNLIGIHIAGLSRVVLQDLNCKWQYFENQSTQKTKINIEIQLGPFEPRLEDCSNVDQRYFVRPHYIYFEEFDKELNWRTEIEGLDQSTLRIRHHTPFANRLRWPWTFFPEMVLHQYILTPLIERILLDQGYYLLHAGGVAKNGEATLFIGRGATYKTSLTLDFLKKGYQLLGDDFVIVKDNQIFCFPTSLLFLQFTSQYLKDERIGFWDQFHLAYYLATAKKADFNIVSSAKLARAFILLSQQMPKSQSLESNERDNVTRIVLNQLLERQAYVHYRYIIGHYLDVYDLAFPQGRDSFEEQLRQQVQRSFASISMETLTAPLDYPGDLYHNVAALTETQR